MKSRSLWLFRLLFIVSAVTVVLLACATRTPRTVHQRLLSCLEGEDVTILHTIPVENGTDGLLGVIQYSQDNSDQFLCSFVTEEGCYTCWLPSGWKAQDGTVLTWLGDNTVCYTTVNQGTLLPAVCWTFTYGKTDDQPRITAHWETVREPHITAFAGPNPLLKFYSDTIPFAETYPFYQWNLLPAKQYTIPSENGGHLQTWEVELRGLLCWPECSAEQDAFSPNNVRQTAFHGLWRQAPDTPLSLYQLDDTLAPECLAEIYLEQEGTDVNQVLKELSQKVFEEWAYSQ